MLKDGLLRIANVKKVQCAKQCGKELFRTIHKCKILTEVERGRTDGRTGGREGERTDGQCDKELFCLMQ